MAPSNSRPVRSRSPLLAALALLLVGSLAGCVGARAVRPQEKEFLADRIMQFEPSPAEAANDEHVLTNREASFGGRGTSGGGCGCN
jgi:hypothetical protein